MNLVQGFTSRVAINKLLSLIESCVTRLQNGIKITYLVDGKIIRNNVCKLLCVALSRSQYM